MDAKQPVTLQSIHILMKLIIQNRVYKSKITSASTLNVNNPFELQ